VADNAAGQKLPCPKCGQRLKVPEPVEMRTMAGVLPVQQKPAAVPRGKEWFYQQDGKPCGPLTWVELKNLVGTGVLSPEDRVWSEGMADWKPGGAVANLFPKHAKPPATESDGSNAGKWFEGLGVLFFGGTMGLAFLLFIGYIVWKGVKKTAVADTPVAIVTSSAEGEPKKETPKEAKDKRLEPTEIFDRCSPSVARVQVAGWTGSGFLARPGIVVTNSHVISEGLAEKITVTFPSAAGGNTPLPAALLHEDRKRDLAVLQIETNFKPIPLATSECPRGERVVVIGSPATPDGNVVENSITAGEMNASVTKDNLKWYQISAAINGGNSGGPVFNSHAEVIGIATWTYLNKQAMNYAVPYSDIIKGIDRAVARDQREREVVAAEHDATMVFVRLGKTATVCGIGMSMYADVRENARKAGAALPAAVAREQPRITRGAVAAIRENLDKTFLNEYKPRVFTNKSLAAPTKQRLESLWQLFGEMTQWLDKPADAGFDDKAAECLGRLKRVRNELHLELGMKEEPLPTRGELQKWGLIP